MAIKAQRRCEDFDISWFCNDIIDRGRVVVALQYQDRICGKPVSGLEPPIGVVLQNVIDFNTVYSRFIEPGGIFSLQGGKVEIMIKGTLSVDTDDETIKEGDLAYYDLEGRLTTSGIGPVGRFLTKADADGYVTVHVDFRLSPLEMLFPAPTPMETAFLLSIKESPRDEFRIRIFLEYLEENGDKRYHDVIRLCFGK